MPFGTVATFNSFNSVPFNSKEMNTHVDIGVMIEGAEMLVDDEIREKDSSCEY